VREEEEVRLMTEEQQQQRINQAAQEFANAIVEAQRAVAERGISAQQLNTELTQKFFTNVIEHLQRMGEETRGATQELAEQTQRSQEAAQELAQESARVYMAFLNTMTPFGPVGSGEPGGTPR
jgi:Zn-dependent oligopeptidase